MLHHAKVIEDILLKEQRKETMRLWVIEHLGLKDHLKGPLIMKKGVKEQEQREEWVMKILLCIQDLIELK